MFDAGIIMLDDVMYIKLSGAVQDHGYFFRTTSEKMKHVFTIERMYDFGRKS